MSSQSNLALEGASSKTPLPVGREAGTVQQAANNEERYNEQMNNPTEAKYQLPNKRSRVDSPTSPNNKSSKKAYTNKYNSMNITQNITGRFQHYSTPTRNNKPQEKVTYTQPDISDIDDFPLLGEPVPLRNKFPPWMVLSARDDQSTFKYSNMFKIVKELKSKINVSFAEGDIKRQYNGNIVFKIYTNEQYQKVKKISKIVDIPCTISPHKFLNIKRRRVFSLLQGPR